MPYRWTNQRTDRPEYSGLTNVSFCQEHTTQVVGSHLVYHALLGFTVPWKAQIIQIMFVRWDIIAP